MADITFGPPHPRHARLAQRLIEAATVEGWPVGYRLTEEDCAHILEVSRTPARAALRLLAGLEIVGRQAGRGFVLLRAGPDLAGLMPIVPEAADAQLRAALIRDRLAGQIGIVQSQAELVRRYQVGLPTLQRVLSRMEQEGLVAHEGWQWSFVPTLETRQSREASYQLRLLLEPASLLLPGLQVDTGLLRQLIAEHDAFLASLDTSAWDAMRIFDLDARFHEALAGFGSNPFIRTIIRQQNALRRFLEVGSYGDQPRVQAWCREHQSIMRALVADRAAEASELLRRHLVKAAEVAADSFANQSECCVKAVEAV
ncbi:MAG: FCD domain-containing protein [Janthinobacterium lividum]